MYMPPNPVPTVWCGLVVAVGTSSASACWLKNFLCGLCATLFVLPYRPLFGLPPLGEYRCQIIEVRKSGTIHRYVSAEDVSVCLMDQRVYESYSRVSRMPIENWLWGGFFVFNLWYLPEIVCFDFVDTIFLISGIICWAFVEEKIS